MKKIMLIAALAAAMPAFAGHIKISGLQPGETLRSRVATINYGRAAKAVENVCPTELTADANGTVEVTLTASEPLNYSFVGSSNIPMMIYAAPDDEITVSVNPEGIATFGGSQLMESVGKAQSEFFSSFMQLQKQAGAAATDGKRQALMAKYAAMQDSLIRANLDNPGGLFAISLAGPEAANETIDLLQPTAYDNILRPLYDGMQTQLVTYRQRMAAAEKIKPGLPAPDFTLPNREGEPVSLSSLRGKWVILDLWGSWCGWCIKGFPQMKENYAELKDRVEILGVACRDSKEAWIAALNKYQLPWINVWQDPDAETQVSDLYAVEGYPTKLIIDPQGNIANVTVGEDPEFYTVLRSLL